MDLFLKINELGQAVEGRWRRENFNEDALPTIAADELRSANIPQHIEPEDVLHWTLKQNTLPKQFDTRANFGDPPITLFTAPGFHIDVYFWFEGTTAIHQHSFCGAFQVLGGSSIHSVYDFEEARAINLHMKFGRLSLRSSELLAKGDVQPIVAGRQYIHSLFHLDYPSATLIVRTTNSPLDLPQFEYHKPGLAIDSFYENELTTRKLQVISALERISPDHIDDTIDQLITDSDLQTVFSILNYLYKVSRADKLADTFKVGGDLSRLEKAIEKVGNNDKEAASLFADVFRNRSKIETYLKIRRLVTSPELRFFIALLMNLEDREAILDLVRERFPDSDPKEKILDLVYELSNIRSTEGENLLGISGFDDVDLFVLEELLNGGSQEEIAEMIRSQFQTERAEQIIPMLSERLAALRSSPMTSPLLP